MRCAWLVLLLSGVASAQSPELTKEFQAGVDAFRLGHYDEARGHLEKARDLDPKLPGPFRFLAAVDKAQGKWVDCLADARHALALNPQSAEAPETRKLYDECRTGAGLAPYRGELGDSAAVAVTSNVPAASVKIGGLIMGGTPMAPRPITAGKLEIDVEKRGWKPKHIEVEAPAGIVTDVDVELDPDPNAQGEGIGTGVKATKGWLVVPPRSGNVRIDSRPGASDKIELEPGTHVVELETPGEDLWRRRVRITAGQETFVKPQFVNTATREHQEHIGFIILGGAGALLATGFGFALASERASNEARDIQRVESLRDPSQPIDGSLEPVRTRADFDAAVSRANRDAIISDVAYGAGLVATGVAVYYFYKGARERTDVLPPFAVAPTRGGALIGKAVAW
jgi:hypothetical protein